MKALLWFLGVIIALLLIVFILVFSPIGNAIVKPIAQSYIDKYSPVNIELETFSLSPSKIGATLKSGDKLDINLNGDIHLFSLGADLNLVVDAKDISLFGDVVGVPLNGAFRIDATAKGNMDKIDATLKSDIGKGDTDIQATLISFSPSQIKAKISNLQVAELLALIGQKPYANALLNVDADIVGDENMNFNGITKIFLDQGSIDPKLIAQDFNITGVPNTKFTTQLDAELKDSKMTHSFLFDSNVGKIASVGNSDIKALSTETDYELNLVNLSPFSPLVGMALRGDVRTKGMVKGDMKELSIQGISDVANSNTLYHAILKDLAPFDVELQSKNLNLAKVLWMINMPQYVRSNTVLNVGAKINDFANGMSIKSQAAIQGSTNNAVMKKEFDMDMPDTPFTLQANTDITKGKGSANVIFDSTIAKVESKDIAIVLSPLNVDLKYTATLPDLKKLKFATTTELQGEILAQGEAKIGEKIYATFNTTSLGGSIKAILDGDKLSANLSDLNTLNLLRLAQMPEVFSSKINGDLDYNVAQQNGVFNAKISEGKMLENQLTTLAAKYLKTNLTNEVYEDTTLNAKIDKMLITSDLSLKSNNTSINTKDAKINLNTSTINANINAGIKDKKINIILSQSLSSPSVKIDAGDLIKDEATKLIQKHGDKLKEKGLEKAQDLFKKLF